MSDIDYKDIFIGPNRTFYETNPTFSLDPIIDDITYSEPEQENMNIRKLRRATNSLNWRSYIKSFVVSRNNKIIWEKYLHNSTQSDCNNVHSVSKSILSALVGIAIDQGLLKLTDKVFDILPEMSDSVTEDTAREITLEHLLTMTAGISWLEDSTEYKIERKKNWLKAILERRMITHPGEVFNYNTGLSHVLSAIIQKVSGVSTCEYAHKNIFDKLDMLVAQWSWDPQGIFCGGFNFYIAPIDLMKFSLLFLNKGVYKNEQIIPQKWVEDSTTPKIDVDGIFYGYYWWVDFIKGFKVYYAWGYGGQFVYIIPKLEITVIITSDTRYYSKDYDARSLIRRYIIPAVLN